MHPLSVYLNLLEEEGTKPFLANVEACVDRIWWGNREVPLMVNEAQWDNAIVCSPYSFYIAYPQEIALPKWIQTIPKHLSALMKWGKIDRVVSLNNWLFNTNLWWSGDVEQMLDTVLKKYPEHAICLRSVHDQSLLEQLQKVGFRLLPARQIYLSDTQTDAPFVNRRFHKDSKLLDKTSYRILRHHEINRAEASRLRELFEWLHIEKYSRRNPQYTTRFIGYSLEIKFLEWVALEREGRIDACCGFYCTDREMTVPLSGIDPTVPQSEGLYRLISLLVLLEARSRRLLLNHSGGVGQFKMLRGAYPKMEYTAIYDAHLPFHRRLPWSCLNTALRHLAVPIMKNI